MSASITWHSTLALAPQAKDAFARLLHAAGSIEQPS